MGNRIIAGILHSASGTMAASESPLVSAALMAIDEINAAGGVLGYYVEPVIHDGKSSPDVFATEAAHLIERDGASVIFGCWTSASRKAVKSVVERLGGLLFYPVQYEGFEESPNIIYTGLCLNQQVEPAIKWCFDKCGPRAFFIGSDYVYPRIAIRQAAALLAEIGGVSAGDVFLPLGEQEMREVVDAIIKAKPDFILNAINGDSNIAFFRELGERGAETSGIAVMSLSFSETELMAVEKPGEKHYTCWSYFQNIATKENASFIERFRQRFGAASVTSDPIATAYSQPYLWKEAVERAGRFTPMDVIKAAPGVLFNGPGGKLEILPNHHVRKVALIGKATPSSGYEVVWSSPGFIDPEPWLGVERQIGAHFRQVKDALQEYPDAVHAKSQLQGEIADRKKAEASLKSSVALLKETERVAHVGTWRLDIRPNRLEWSDEIFRIFEINPQGFGASYDAFLNTIHPDDRDKVNAAYTGSLESKTPYMIEHRLKMKDGRLKYVLEQCETTFDDKGAPLVSTGTVLDITQLRAAELEQKELEKKMRQSQKLESLGVLAGGIAHDFNNLLTSIIGNADIALADMPAYSPEADTVRQIKETAKRAASLTRQMLAYSGRGRYIVESVDISRLVSEISGLIAISISKKANMHYDLAPNLPHVNADMAQLQQVIMNLIINASEALAGETGDISVKTGLVTCESEYLQSLIIENELPPGDYVFIEVSDTGAGIEKDTLAKIFDPFFTTKFTGRGLGLSAVQGIVRGHKGAIKIYSEPGKGTTFKVLLPASEKIAAAPAPKETAPDETWRGSGTILLIDDEEGVRKVGRQLLEKCGFSVITANDGLDGVEKFRVNAETITCVLCDVTMPRMDGYECFHRMRQIKPGALVILMSGYSEQDAMQRYEGGEAPGFVGKPFQLKELRESVRKAIEG